MFLCLPYIPIPMQKLYFIYRVYDLRFDQFLNTFLQSLTNSKVKAPEPVVYINIDCSSYAACLNIGILRDLFYNLLPDLLLPLDNPLLRNISVRLTPPSNTSSWSLPRLWLDLSLL